MKLEFQTIREITVGAVAIEETEFGFYFAKCTKEQRELWQATSEFLGHNARSSTGVRLDFVTDSSFVAVEAGKEGQFEVKIDGRLTHRVTLTEAEPRLCVALGEESRQRRVVITLPSHAEGVLRSVEVADGAIVKRSEFDRKILFIGDSITQGYASRYDFLSYAYQVSQALNAESVIQGIGGAYFVPETVLPIGFEPDTVIVAYGTNDFVTRESLGGVEDNARELLRRVKALYSKARIFVVSPIWRADREPRAFGFEECRGVIAEAAREAELVYVDGYDLVPHHEDFFMDGLHPNDLGFCLYAQNLLRAIAPAVPQTTTVRNGESL